MPPGQDSMDRFKRGSAPLLALDRFREAVLSVIDNLEHHQAEREMGELVLFTVRPDDRTNHELLKMELMLLHNSFLQQLQPEVQWAILRQLTLRRVEEGEVVCHQGDVGDAFYIIHSGCCSIHINKKHNQEEHEKKVAEREAANAAVRARAKEIAEDPNKGRRVREVAEGALDQKRMDEEEMAKAEAGAAEAAKKPAMTPKEEVAAAVAAKRNEGKDDKKTAKEQEGAEEGDDDAEDKDTYITKYGIQVAQIEDGTSFGELSLMGNDGGLRAATVVARKKSMLLMLSRDAFKVHVEAPIEAKLQTKLKFLRGVHVFRDIEEAKMRKIGERMIERRVSMRTILAKQGEAGKRMGFVISGELRVIKAAKLESDRVMEAVRHERKKRAVDESLDGFDGARGGGGRRGSTGGMMVPGVPAPRRSRPSDETAAMPAPRARMLRRNSLKGYEVCGEETPQGRIKPVPRHSAAMDMYTPQEPSGTPSRSTQMRRSSVGFGPPHLPTQARPRPPSVSSSSFGHTPTMVARAVTAAADKSVRAFVEVDTLGRCGFFGHAALINRERHPTCVVAGSATTYLEISKFDVAKFFPDEVRANLRAQAERDKASLTDMESSMSEELTWSEHRRKVVQEVLVDNTIERDRRKNRLRHKTVREIHLGMVSDGMDADDDHAKGGGEEKEQPDLTSADGMMVQILGEPRGSQTARAAVGRRGGSHPFGWNKEDAEAALQEELARSSGGGAGGGDEGAGSHAYSYGPAPPRSRPGSSLGMRGREGGAAPRSRPGSSSIGRRRERRGSVGGGAAAPGAGVSFESGRAADAEGAAAMLEAKLPAITTLRGRGKGEGGGLGGGTPRSGWEAKGPQAPRSPLVRGSPRVIRRVSVAA